MSNVDYPYRDGENLQLGPGTLLTKDRNIFHNGEMWVPSQRHQELIDQLAESEAKRMEPDGEISDSQMRVVAVQGAAGKVESIMPIYQFLKGETT